MNLLDTIKQNRASLASEQAPVTDETQKVQKLLRTKSGKAIGSSDTGISNIGETAAVAQTQGQLGQIGQQLQVQNAQDTISNQRAVQTERLQRQGLEQARKFQTIQAKMQTNQLLSDLQRDRASIDLNKDRAKLEQASFLLAMQDKRYLDDLQEVGRRRRLDDEVRFRQEMLETAFGEQLGLLQDKLQKEDIMQASDREFSDALSQMTVEDAFQVAQMQLDFESKQSDIKKQLIEEGAANQIAVLSGQAEAQGIQGLVQGSIMAGNAAADGKFSGGDETDTDGADEFGAMG